MWTPPAGASHGPVSVGLVFSYMSLGLVSRIFQVHVHKVTYGATPGYSYFPPLAQVLGVWRHSHRAGGAMRLSCMLSTQKQMGDLASIHCPFKFLLCDHTTWSLGALCSYEARHRRPLAWALGAVIQSCTWGSCSLGYSGTLC